MSPSDSDGTPPEASPEALKPAKKKRGFWGWLTGSAEQPENAEAAPETSVAASEVPPAPPEAPPAPTETLDAVPDAAPPPAPVAEEVVAEPPAASAAVEAAPEGVAEPEVVGAPEAVAAPGVLPVPPEAPVTPVVPPPEPAPAAPPSALDGGEAALPELPAEPARAEAAGLPPSAPEPLVEPEPAAAEASEPASEVAVEAAADAGEPLPAALPTPVVEPSSAAPGKKGFWARLASGLARTASSLGQGITDLVSKRKLDADTLEELEEVLIRADLGVETAMRIVEEVGRGRHDKMISPEEVKGLIAAEVERILEPVAKPLVVEHLHKPFVVLMVGVNGSGKTTTIGKLAAQWRKEGRKVVLAAGDTFRAAAIEQLKVWGARTHTPVIAREPGADAAGVAFDALTEARAQGADILLIDTAGRLQNRTELMAELEKIVRVVKKQEPTAPHAVLLVLDATVGQNALSQVEAFTRIAGVTGLVMTKLDGTARGGILVAIAAKHKLPVHLIGVGEAAEDLQPFTARDFARAIAGLD